jgi:hypothetical protein
MKRTKHPSRNALARRCAALEADKQAAVDQCKYWRSTFEAEQARRRKQADIHGHEIRRLRERLEKFTDAVIDSPGCQIGVTAITEHTIHAITFVAEASVSTIRLPARGHVPLALLGEIAERLADEIRKQALQKLYIE